MMEEIDDLVCVLCGIPWDPPVVNACPNPKCKGFCTWGKKKGGDPSSWIKTKNGWIPRPVPSSENEKT